LGYVKTFETDTLTLPSDPQYTVTIKRKASFGDQRAAQSAMLKVDGATGALSDPEWGAYIGSLMTRLIVNWNITDESDQPLPITLENIDKLEPADGQFLFTEASKRAALRGDAQERPFEKPSITPSADET
jgi:hypothetical protein